MKRFQQIIVLIFFFSCESIGFYPKEIENQEAVASVYDKKLYEKEIKFLLPKNLDTEDSIILTRNIINNWATQQLLLKKAEENALQDDHSQIDKQVEEYRQSLLVNGYKERLIKQQLDTLVERQEIQEYYLENSKNFRLNKELIKVRYLHLSSDLNNLEEVISYFKQGTLKHLEALELRQLTFKSMILNDSVWMSLENALSKTPFSRDRLLEKGEFYQKEDSLGVYLIVIKDVLLRNEIAPLSHIELTIRQMILHKRKLQLIRDIEKIILKDAIQNKIFQTY